MNDGSAEMYAINYNQNWMEIYEGENVRQASTSDKCNMIATTYFTHESMNFSFYYNKHIATINEPLLRDVPMDGVYQGYAQCFESKEHNSFVCQSIIL